MNVTKINEHLDVTIFVHALLANYAILSFTLNVVGIGMPNKDDSKHNNYVATEEKPHRADLMSTSYSCHVLL